MNTKSLPPQTSIKDTQQDVNELASGAIVSLSGKFFGRGVQALTQVILARYFGPAVFGIFALGWTIFRLLGAFAPLGFDKGILRFGIGESEEKKAQLRDVFNKTTLLGSTFSFMLALLLYFSAPYLSAFFDKPNLAPVLQIFGFVLPLLTLLKILSATMRTSRNMQFAVVMEDIVQPGLFLLLIGLIILTNRGLVATTTAVFVSFLLALVVGIILLMRLFPGFFSWPASNNLTHGDLLRYSFPTAMAGIFTLLTVWTDRLFLGYFSDSAEVGIYQALSQSSILFAVILQGLSAIFAPMISNLYDQENMSRLNELYKIGTRWGVYLSIPLVLTILINPQNVIVSIFGPDYMTGSLPLSILTIGQFVNVATGSVGFILLMTGYQKRWFKISILSFLLNIILNIVLIPNFGMNGAAVATAISISVLYLSGLYFVYAIHQLWPYDQRYTKGVVAGIVAIVYLVALQNVSIPYQIVRLLVNAGGATAVFFASLYLLGFETEDKTIIQLFLKRVRKNG